MLKLNNNNNKYLDLVWVGPKTMWHTRPAATSYQSISAAGQRPTSAANLLAITDAVDQWDRQTDRRTNGRSTVFTTRCYAHALYAMAPSQSVTRRCSTKTAEHRITHTFNGPFSRTTQVSRYQKGNTNLDFSEARDSEWQWHQLGRMQVCTSLQTDNHASTPPLCFLQAGCPSCRTGSHKQKRTIAQGL